MSQLLSTGLQREEMEMLIGLTEQGYNPEALAAAVKELRKEESALAAQAEGKQHEEREKQRKGRPEWNTTGPDE